MIPALYHQLVLADPTRGYLKNLERSIRKAVRVWTKLPKDTPIPAFYADAKDGGLGLSSMEHTVPGMKARRLGGLMRYADLVVREVVKLPEFQKEFRKWSQPAEF